MNHRRALALLVLAAPLCAQTPTAAPKPSPAAPGGAPQPPAAAPNAERDAARAKHKAAMQLLAPLIGEWSAKGTYGTAKPDGSYDEQTGAWSVRWLYEGAHLEIDFDVLVNGERRRYKGLFSYNPNRERYETTWSGDTGYRFTEAGTFDASGKTLTLTSRHDFPRPDKQTVTDSVFRFVDENTITVEDTQTNPETGKKERSYSVELKRKK